MVMGVRVSLFFWHLVFDQCFIVSDIHIYTYTWKPFVLCFGVEPSKRNPFQNKGHLGFRYILTQSHAILFEYGIVHLTEGAVETPKEKAADTAKQDFTDATVAFEAKSKCILAAILFFL